MQAVILSIAVSFMLFLSKLNVRQAISAGILLALLKLVAYYILLYLKPGIFASDIITFIPYFSLIIFDRRLRSASFWTILSVIEMVSASIALALTANTGASYAAFTAMRIVIFRCLVFVLLGYQIEKQP